MLTLTAAAAAAILDAAERSNAHGMALRLAARGNADGTLELGFGFDEERDQDHVVESHGARVLVAPPSQPLLAGTTLDFGEVAPGKLGFVVLRGPARSGKPGPAADAGR